VFVPAQAGTLFYAVHGDPPQYLRASREGLTLEQAESVVGWYCLEDPTRRRSYGDDVRYRWHSADYDRPWQAMLEERRKQECGG
jgi:hypothetical protein